MNLNTRDIRKKISQRSNKAIEITDKTKATLLFGDGWLILASHVVKEEGEYHVYRHASYDIEFDHFFVDRTPKGWGWTKLVKFYEATEEQKKFMINKLSEKGYKFVKILNKLIER